MNVVTERVYATYGVSPALHLVRGILPEHEVLLNELHEDKLVNTGKIRVVNITEGVRIRAKVQKHIGTTVTITEVVDQDMGYYIVNARVGATHFGKVLHVGETYQFVCVPGESIYLVVED